MRCENALITGSELGFLRELLQFLGDDCAPGAGTLANQAHVVVKHE